MKTEHYVIIFLVLVVGIISENMVETKTYNDEYPSIENSALLRIDNYTLSAENIQIVIKACNNMSVRQQVCVESIKNKIILIQHHPEYYNIPNTKVLYINKKTWNGWYDD